MELRGRQLVPGRAIGRAVVMDALSFYGDVDPYTGRTADGRSVASRVIVARRPRGSTVGSYVIYALKANGVAPAAIVMSRVDPIIVAGCVLAGIPLVDSIPEDQLSEVRDGDLVELDGSGVVRVRRTAP
ncbi:aconitase X swivel domain-containing protein [Acidilobus sp.]|jgi:predicted aconitase with swiveling domain|uniref:aconitase X swivel domain-containing protein n=1 Tax=Acidilobus sp. TaxID=1872109 RepID=UPI003D072E55